MTGLERTCFCVLISSFVLWSSLYRTIILQEKRVLRNIDSFMQMTQPLDPTLGPKVLKRRAQICVGTTKGLKHAAGANRQPTSANYDKTVLCGGSGPGGAHPHNRRCLRHRGKEQPQLGRTAAVESNSSVHFKPLLLNPVSSCVALDRCRVSWAWL